MLSILTNFGCHWSCPYCVYRDQKIKIAKTKKSTFDFKKLEEVIKQMDGDEISISGGGDPLYNIEENNWFYKELFRLGKKYDKKLELHTTYIIPEFFYKSFHRVVFHLHSPVQLRLIKRKDMYGDRGLMLPNNVRVVFVMQPHYNRPLIRHIVKEAEKTSATELVSFRQLIGKDGKAVEISHKFLKEGHLKNWFYIEQCDYNDYYVNNTIEVNYLDIK